MKDIKNIKAQSEAFVPSALGDFTLKTYAADDNEKMPHLVLINPETDVTKPVNLRIHSECVTGDIFQSQRCDCGPQLHFAMQYIKQNTGVILYLRQEGRGIGLIDKLKAYEMQDDGYDTATANEALGYDADERDYDMVFTILKDLGITTINLMTNNPKKLKIFENSAVILKERIPIEIAPTDENYNYLKTKKERFGHLLTIE